LSIFLALFAGWVALRFVVPWAIGGVPSQLASEARLWQLLWGAKPFLALLVALLPAAGAILSGLRHAAGYERVADRSVRIAAPLQALRTDYAIARERLDLDGTAVTLLDTAKAQAEMIGACRSLYGGKRLTLPV
jgi:hypothetical protein